MWLHELWQRWMGRPSRQTRRQRSQPRIRRRLMLEGLEDRTLLSSPSTPAQLISAITSANHSNTPTTITLQANSTFDFTSANNATNGSNALPVITGHITIVGNGDVLERTGSSAFRFFDVAPNSSLTLQNLTLQGGLAQGTGAAAEGGAVFSSGTLSLSGVTVQSNKAAGSNGANGGQSAAGSSGSDAFGGGLFMAAGSVTLTNDTLYGNAAVGGNGGNGGNGGYSSTVNGSGGNGGNGGSGAGGALYVAAGSVSLLNDTLANNSAVGGNAGNGGNAGRSYVPAGNGGNGGNGTGGGSALYFSSTVLANTIIAEDTVTAGASGAAGTSQTNPGTPGSAGTAFAPDVSGNVTSSDHDLIGDGTGFSSTRGSFDQIGTSSNPIDPLLGPLQNNGGPTQTMALQYGSPAIDAGDNFVVGLSSIDQRGYGRIVGSGVDIGAYEYNAATPNNADLSITASAPTQILSGEQIAYKLTVTNHSTTMPQYDVTVVDTILVNTTLVSCTPPAGWSSSQSDRGFSNVTVAAWTGTLAANSSATFTLVVRVPIGTPTNTVITNTASVGPTTGDPNPANNSVTRTTTVTGSDTAALITAITNANNSGKPTTITLPTGALYDFTSANNTGNGSNALPVITGNVTIVGNNDVLERTGSSAFRFFDVTNSGSLTLQNLTLQGGLAQGTGAAAVGGAVFSSGALSLSGVTVQSN